MEFERTEFPPRELSQTETEPNRNPCSACRHLIEAVIFEDFENKNLWESTTESWTKYFFKGHYGRLGLIRRSAQLCDMCNLIVDHWPSAESEENGEDPKHDSEYWIFAQPILSGDPPGTKSFLLTTNWGDDHKEEQRFELFHKQNPEISDATNMDENETEDSSFVRVFGSRRYRRMRRETSAYSGSDECFALATKWMAECNRTHEICASKEDSFIPKRLLDVGASASKESIRLYESHTIREPYVALSYCWGGRVSLRTTTFNRELHLQAIPLYNMPNTFRDAITIVRKLGFRYLWIDALCIIQDSEEDWQKEAEVMDRVYAKAALTISCADSANSWSGIFVQRKRQRSIPLHLSAYPDLRLQDLHVSVLEDSKDVYSDLEESAVNGRAWTLQERLMSRANLHFTNEALIWECRTHTRTEDGHSSSCHPFYKNIANYYTSAADDAILLWYIIVEDYTRRKLTYDSDKLAAVAGLARYLSSRVAGASGYSFGLWKSDLPRGLLWGRKAGSLEDIPHSATTYRAPCWSWASRKGEISYNKGVVSSPPLKSEFDLQIHNTSTTKALSSHLVVEGYLQETYYDPRAKYDACKSTIGFNCNIRFWMDNLVFEGRCWCLYVGAWMFSDTVRLTFLVLQESLGGYGRIGLASFTVKDYLVVDFGEKMNTIMRSPRRCRLTLCSPEGIRI